MGKLGDGIEKGSEGGKGKGCNWKVNQGRYNVRNLCLHKQYTHVYRRNVNMLVNSSQKLKYCMYKGTTVLHVQGNCSTGCTSELQYCMYKGTAVLNVQWELQYCMYKGTAVLHVQGNCTVLHLQENCSTACTKELHSTAFTRELQYCMYKGNFSAHVQGKCSTECTRELQYCMYMEGWYKVRVVNRLQSFFFKSFNKTRNIFKTVCC